MSDERNDAKSAVHSLSEAQIESIAERAKEKVVSEIYVQVGKSVLTRLIWLAVAAIVGLAYGKGWIGK